ncbi:MAG: hypothetical protein ABEJ82_01410 [Haloplanus sp.]
MSDGDDTETELTPARVEALVAEYEDREPFDTVEREQIATLPSALAAGDFGRRDAEWVVRWYYRRRSGDAPDAELRTAEEAFYDNDYESIADAIARASEASGLDDALAALTSLAGVDTAVASAFLAFLDPDRYLAVGPREWRALAAVGDLSGAYPESVSAADYRAYLDAARSAVDRLDCDLWDLYRALWRLEGDAW